MSNPGEVFRFVSNWTTRSTGCAGPRQFLWVLALRPYSPGGSLNVLSYAPTRKKYKAKFPIFNFHWIFNDSLINWCLIENCKLFWVLALRPYSPGGTLNALAYTHCCQRASGHRLRLGLHRYLICFAPLAFVPQRQATHQNGASWCTKWYVK